MEDSSSTNSTTQLRQEELIFGTNNKKQWPVVTAKIIITQKDKMQGFNPV
jgi:hypothetical protein